LIVSAGPCSKALLDPPHTGTYPRAATAISMP
jgi:hypothetical protein